MGPPLDGIKVMDFSIAVAAPLGAAMLADMGARVIKVERVQGESQRLDLPAGMDELLADRIAQGAVDEPSWIAVNRGKEDLAIDVRGNKGKEIILGLLKDVDVIVESFRPGVMEKLGLGYEAISKMNPRIIYCSFTGYGETGPLARRAGGDMWSQAMSGMISENVHPNDRPRMVPIGMVDNTSGILVAYAVITALYVRERTGEGQYIALNNLSAAMYLQFHRLAEFLMDPRKHSERKKSGTETIAPPFGPYKAKDGDVLTIFGSGPLWPAFCKLLGMEELSDDPRFKNDAVRREHKKELEPILDKAFSKKTREEWAQIFRKARMRCDPCLTFEELCSHPQIEENEIIFSTNHPVRGAIKMLGNPIKLEKTQGNPIGPSPLLGEHTEKILLDLGYGLENITELEKEGVIKTLK